MDWTEIIKTIITVCVPAAVTLISTKGIKRLSKMHNAKQSILQMMMEDVIAVELLDKPPCNHTNIHYEYDIYHKNGGNSDIDEKMKEYEAWYKSIDMEVAHGKK